MAQDGRGPFVPAISSTYLGSISVQLSRFRQSVVVCSLFSPALCRNGTLYNTYYYILTTAYLIIYLCSVYCVYYVAAHNLT